MKRFLFVLFACSAFALLPGRAFGLAYVLNEGQDSFTFAMSYSSFDTIYNGDGDEAELGGSIELIDVGVLWEHGLGNNFAFRTFIPWSHAERDDSVIDVAGSQNLPSQSGISDVRFELQYNFLLEPVALAARGGLKMAGDYEEAELASFGDGQTDVDFTLIATRFFAERILANVELGYRFRTGVKDDEWFQKIDIGVQITSRFIILANFQGIDNFGDVNLGDPDALVFANTEEDIYTVGGTLAFTFSPRVSAFAQVSDAISGKNTSNETRTVVGVTVNFD